MVRSAHRESKRGGKVLTEHLEALLAWIYNIANRAGIWLASWAPIALPTAPSNILLYCSIPL